MNGIDLNSPITFRHASLRFFQPNEYHITRYCADDVLVLVYEGTLRFRENGIDRQVKAGEYYIQKAGLLQEGIAPSDAPKYLYVHFQAQWTDDSNSLGFSGAFQYPHLKPLMEKLDQLSHSTASYIEKAGYFYELLCRIQRVQRKDTLATQMGRFVTENAPSISGLEDLCNQFHYSKNHIINLFRQEYGMTPVEYINDVKLNQAMHLLEVTSSSTQQIASQSGFHNYSHFYRLFCRKSGMPPAKWRKAILLQPMQK